MQLVPSTAQRFGCKGMFSPKQNVDAGVRYLRRAGTIQRQLDWLLRRTMLERVPMDRASRRSGRFGDTKLCPTSS